MIIVITQITASLPYMCELLICNDGHVCLIIHILYEYALRSGHFLATFLRRGVYLIK